MRSGMSRDTQMREYKALVDCGVFCLIKNIYWASFFQEGFAQHFSRLPNQLQSDYKWAGLKEGWPQTDIGTLIDSRSMLLRHLIYDTEFISIILKVSAILK